jgi:hypothetical protein
LGPVRTEVERIQKLAHAAIKTLAHGDAYGPGLDWTDLCIEECRDLWACERDARASLRQAELVRDGYDTWDEVSLAEHTMELRALVAVLGQLARAVDKLRALEREGFNANAKIAHAGDGQPSK